MLRTNHDMLRTEPTLIHEEKPTDMITVALIDWDDTVIPTTLLQNQNLYEDLELIGAQVVGFLSELKQNFQYVYIVTNGSECWVNHCIEQWFSKALTKALQGFSVLSAYSLYHHISNKPVEWKRLTMQKILSALREKHQKATLQIFNVGDSLVEHQALDLVKSELGLCEVKKLKLLDSPWDVTVFLKQQEMIHELLLRMRHLPGDCFWRLVA